MSKPFLVGITGGIGSGKSTVSRIFKVLGVPVYYADDRGKSLLEEDQTLIEQVRSAFGEKSYESSGKLNTQYLAGEVFPVPEKLEVLNGLVHPAVARDFRAWTDHHSKSPCLLKEAALLYETGSYEQLDSTVCVMAPKELRLERVLLRDTGRSRQQVMQIMERQTDDLTRKQLADYLIQNNGKELLIPQVQKVHVSLLKLAGN